MQKMTSFYESRLISLNLQFFSLLGELWVYLAIFETTLRTFLNLTLSHIYQSAEWWSVENLLRNHERRLLSSRRKDHSNPIDELSLGFWVTLFSRKYHERIWRPIASKNPTLEVLGRRKFQRYLMIIQEFRNKLAHHNITLQRNIARDIDYMQQITELIAPTIARGMKQRAQTLKKILVAEAGFEPTTQRL